MCVSVSRHVATLLQGSGCNLGEWQAFHLLVHYWADLQSMHGFHCYDDIAPNVKYQRVLVLALCLVFTCHHARLRLFVKDI